MWLNSIELAQVGTFAQPVRIDGIGPGLNVLAGSNELGKSTILSGLIALFTEAHRTSKQSIKDLRPYGGGAPIIGCSFTLGEKVWHVEKQYLAAHKALLEQVNGGETHHGADAENRLADLMGSIGGLQASLPLLWVEQGKSFDVPELSDGARMSLGQLLAAQAETTSGVSSAQAVLRKVNDELFTLLTKTDRVKKGGAYDKLLTERAAVALDLERARTKLGEARERLDQLTKLESEEADLSDTDVSEALAKKINDQKDRLREAQDARRHIKQVNERIEFLTHQKLQRAETLGRFDEGLIELRTLSERMGEADVELTGIAAAIADVERRQKLEIEAASATTEREQSLRTQLDHARAATAAVATRNRLQSLTAQKQRLDAISHELTEVDHELVDLGWSDDLIGELRQALNKLGQIEARQSAGAPRVKINYLSGVTQGIRIEGEEVVDGVDVIARGPVILEIEGLGQIEITPGASDTLELAQQDQGRTQALIDELLAKMKAKDEIDAEARDQLRRSYRDKRELLTRELNVLAPTGCDPINAEFAVLQAAELKANERQDNTIATETESGASVDELVQALDEARAELSKIQERVDALKVERAKLDERRTSIATELRIRRTRRDELEAIYVRSSDTEDSRLALVAQVDETELALNSTTRERTAWQEIALSDEAIDALEKDIVSLEARRMQRSQQLGVVRQDMRRVEGMLTRDFEDGAGEHVSELEARFEELEERVGVIEQHIAALRLLSSELTAEIARLRDEISRPLAGRLSGLAKRVWPTAEIPLTSDLTIGGLSRQGQLEASSAVSAGTREQMAVLGRLAYAGLLADGGEALPVILDDPLAFSDDDRLGALFDVMAQAAETHQIIVLTCHERAFEPLVTRYGATNLSIDNVVQLRAAS